MDALPAEIEAWRSGGRELSIFGRRVFTRVEEGGSGEPVLYLHGFPTSSFDVRHALPFLAKGRRVVAHDHLGFGLSEKPLDYSYSLLEQAEVALGIWKALGIDRGHVVAHDYGTSVATELCARAARGVLPFRMSSVTFCNGSMLLELAKLRVTQKLLRNQTIGPLFARLSSYRMFRLQMRRILARPEAVTERELELHWWLISSSEGRLRLPRISTYLDERVRFRQRWVGSLGQLAVAGVPVRVVWARKDPIAIPLIAERVAEMSGVTPRWLDDLGHYPMLESPERWAGAVLEGL